MFEFITTFLATVAGNSTLPVINIPATLTPVWSDTATQAVATTGTDPLSIMGIIGTAIAAFNIYQTKKNDVKQSGRANALADTDINTMNSLKQTDGGIRDLSKGMDMSMRQLADNPNNKSLLETPLPELQGKTLIEYMKSERGQWEKDFRQYYLDTAPQPTEFAKDPVLAKTATVNKLSKPTGE